MAGRQTRGEMRFSSNRLLRSLEVGLWVIALFSGFLISFYGGIDPDAFATRTELGVSELLESFREDQQEEPKRLPPPVLLNHSRSHNLDDKERIVKMLQSVRNVKIDNETYDRLPTWTEVTALYGPEPRIIGLDDGQCQLFRSRGKPADQFLAVAGFFNTGTHLLSKVLMSNCRLGRHQNGGVVEQVPWGKHHPAGNATFRRTYRHPGYNPNEGDQSVLVAVIIRDPFRWMPSCCHHQYALKWKDGEPCPKLVRFLNESRSGFGPLIPKDKLAYESFVEDNAENMKGNPVSVRYAKERRTRHWSMAHLWNDWYGEYWDVVHGELPRLIIRYEDLLFHAKETVSKICKCAGGVMYPNFHFPLRTTKTGRGHGGKLGMTRKDHTGLVDAIIKYGSSRGRFDGFTPSDIEYAKKHLNPDFMEALHYNSYG